MLPARDVEALAVWLESRRQQRANSVPFERWLARARGAAVPGTTTAGVLALTRDEPSFAV